MEAFVFPGQGSQSVGMQKGLAADYAVVRETWQEAGEALGEDLWRIASEGPEETLGRTEITQPAMLAAGVAAWRAWREAGGEDPAVMAGHSLGEYSALVCAGALGFDEAIGLVATRGRLMQEAVPAGKGAMAAVLGLDDDAVGEACRQAAGEEVVEPVNYNAPGQVVIAGDKAAVERAAEAAKGLGAKRAMLLPVSVPAHCSLMRPAAERYREVLDAATLAEPAIPVINNVDVAAPKAPAAIADALYRQLFSPVRWVETVRRMTADGATRLIECGPGRVLAGLARRIERSLETVTLEDGDGLAKALDEEIAE